MSDVPNLTLNDGVEIPQLGFGVFQIPPGETHEAVTRALEIGYRHIDTAQMYQNEAQVGTAVAASGLDRDEVFLTSKLNNGFHRPDDARRAFDETLAALGTDHVDLFLIHWPLPTLYDGDFVSTWQTMLEFHQDGRARSVGVSNFQTAHLDRLSAETDHLPSVNQIEVHPYLTNDTVREHARAWASSPRPGRRSPRARSSTTLRSARSQPPWTYAGPGGAALAPAARRRGVPEVGEPGPDEGELRPVHLRTRRRRGSSNHRARPWRAWAHRPQPGRVRLPPGLRPPPLLVTGSGRPPA